MRVIELARSLGLDSADLISLLEELGISVRSDASILDERHIRVVRASTAALEAARARRAAREATVREGAALEAAVREGSRVDQITGPPAAPPDPLLPGLPPHVPQPQEPAAPDPAPSYSRPSDSRPRDARLREARSHDAAPHDVRTSDTRSHDAVEDEWSAALSGPRRPVLLWGAPGSGKSTFLAGMMFRQVEDDADPYDWRIMSVGPRAGDYIRSVLQSYRSGGQPNATLVTDAPFRFKVRKVRKARRVFGLVSRGERVRLEADLLLVDPPGELFTISKMRGRSGTRVLQLMQNAAGLLLLIDPAFSDDDDGWVERAPGSAPDGAVQAIEAEARVARQVERQRRYWTMLVENISEIIHHLRGQSADVQAATLDAENRLRVPTAICVTKMDRHRRHAHRPTDFLRDRIGEAAFRVIDSSFSNYTVYACSALGNDVRRNERGVILNGEPKPWGVIDPIRWILEESMQRRHSQLLARFGW